MCLDRCALIISLKNLEVPGPVDVDGKIENNKDGVVSHQESFDCVILGAFSDWNLLPRLSQNEIADVVSSNCQSWERA